MHASSEGVLHLDELGEERAQSLSVSAAEASGCSLSFPLPPTEKPTALLSKLCNGEELLRVLSANTCTEPVYDLQQVVVLPVHRCASASESPCHFPVHRYAPATEAQWHPVS
ncbi:hypothetical protein EPR50_G00004240 [Perca flavescens]|uniref:Uncharacterized protein n=1 Tax=Perca flavescens TaxID=8167 RepID=A0A484DNK0_PERFV|nr:hypothetical protein EPR50_G00004240 [Perca flavescens]